MATFSTLLDRLLEPESRKLVRVRGSEWAIVDYLSTGELQQSVITAGDSTYVADVPKVSPHILGVAGTLEELVETNGRKEDVGIALWRENHNAEQAKLQERDQTIAALVGELLIQRVVEAAAECEPISLDDRRVCRNCRGNGGGVHECYCAQSGVHYMGVVADPEDIITDKPLTQEEKTGKVFDPHCLKCQGEGQASWICGYCEGQGKETVGQERVVNGPHGETTYFQDVAAWIRDGLATLTTEHYSNNTGFGIRLILNLAPLWEKINKEIAEGQPTWQRSRYHFNDWEQSITTTVGFSLQSATRPLKNEEDRYQTKYNLEDAPFEYSYRTDPYRSKSSDKPETWVGEDSITNILPSGEELLAKLQHHYGAGQWIDEGDPEPAGVRRNSQDGLIESRAVAAVVKIPGEILLDQVLEIAADTGYGLGFTYGFIATGEYGPEIFVMNRNEEILARVGLEYTWEQALATTHLVLPQLIKKLQEKGF